MIKSIKYTTVLLLLLFSFGTLWAQSGINTRSPNAAAALEISSSTQGILLPQYALVDVTSNTNPINGPVVGSVIYNTGLTPSTNPKGYYYWSGARWEKMILNNEIDQILKVGVASGTIIPSGIATNNYLSFDNTGIINTIQGVTFTGGTTVTLPAGTYRVDVTLDCYSPNSTNANANTFISGLGNNLYVLNSSLVNASNATLTDIKIYSSISGWGGASIQGYKFSYILTLSAQTGVKLNLNHNNGSSDTSLTQANQSGLVVTFYKFQ